jgi:tetratricopeptide (TPR) repeat protein
MKRFTYIWLLAIVLPLALAQGVERIVILPFDTADGLDIYGPALATGLQRSLNVLDTVYVPPVGDALLVVQRQITLGDVSPAAVTAAFDSNVLVSGDISASGDTATIRLGFAGPRFANLREVSVTAPLSNPAEMLLQAANAVISELELPVSQADRTQLNEVIGQTPSAPSLATVALGSLRFGNVSLGSFTSAAQLDATSSWVLSEYARALIQAGDLERALSTSLLAVQYEPNDVEAWVVRGLILDASDDSEGAQAAFDRALTLNPNHAQALIGKAQVTADASLAEQAIAIYPRSVEAFLTLASLQANNPQRVLQTLRRGAGQIPESVILQQGFIEQAIALGDAAGALNYLRGTVLTQPNPSAQLYAIATRLPDTFRQQALEIISDGLARHPESLTLTLAKADLQERSGDLAAAEATLAQANQRNPNNVQVANALALVQIRQGNMQAAEATLSAVADSSDVVQFNLAQLYLSAGRPQLAVETLERYLLAQPNDAEARALLGVALGRSGRYSEAISTLDAALASDPSLDFAAEARAIIAQEQAVTGGDVSFGSSEASAAYASGIEALSAGAYLEARNAFARARELEDNPLFAFYEGYASYFAGNSRDAVTAYTVALAGFPDSDIVLNNLGLAQLDIGRFDLALESLERARSLNANNANARLNLGLVYYELGRYGDAVLEWEAAIALDSSLQSAVESRLADARARAR